MNRIHALNAYRTVGVQSGVTDASPHQLVAMLFDGAMDRLAAAQGAVERKDRALQGELVGRAISIIDTLRASLDPERGGALADNLHDLYDYMQRRLLEATVASDNEPLVEVQALLATVRSGWESIPEELRRVSR